MTDTAARHRKECGRGRNRMKRYPYSVSVAFTVEQFEALEREVDRENWPFAGAVRAVVEAGLPVWRERRRKARKAQEGQHTETMEALRQQGEALRVLIERTAGEDRP